METKLVNLSYEIEVQPGEQLTLPESIINSVGVGRWIVTIQPKNTTQIIPRSHDAFLNGYAPEDEGLYDDQLDLIE